MSEQQKTLHFSSASHQSPAGQGKALCTQMKYNQVLRSWCIDLSKKQGGGKKGQGLRGEIERQSLSLCFGTGQAPKPMKRYPRWQNSHKQVAFPRRPVPFSARPCAVCQHGPEADARAGISSAAQAATRPAQRFVSTGAILVTQRFPCKALR